MDYYNLPVALARDHGNASESGGNTIVAEGLPGVVCYSAAGVLPAKLHRSRTMHSGQFGFLALQV